jgi:hypothetical protein
MVTDSHFGLASFNEIFQQVQALELLYANHEDKIKPEDDLPKELIEAFQNLRFHLNIAKTSIIQTLKVGVIPSPSIRKFCLREPQDPNTSMIRVAYLPPRQNHGVLRIMPFFDILFNDEQLFLAGLHTVTDEIERLIRSDKTVKVLISPFIASRLSSLSVVSECLHQLHLFQPWARKIEDGMDKTKNAELMNNYQRTFGGWAPILAVNFEGSHIYQYADPSGGKFNYPVQRRRNKQNVEILRKAEANLDAFWEAVDRHYKTNANEKTQYGVFAYLLGAFWEAVDRYYKTNANEKTQYDVFAHLLGGDRAVQRTAEWVEQDRSKKPLSKDEYVYQPFSSIFHDRTNQVPGNFNRASISAQPHKTKTRNIVPPANGDEQPEPHTTIPQEPPQPERIFRVDKRAHEVFKVLFHSPNSPDLPGELPWSDFLHAMLTMGFSAEKAHGSAWNFFPKALDIGVERSIQFHEPHPSNKIPFYWARRYGRRLARAYGWMGEMFRMS